MNEDLGVGGASKLSSKEAFLPNIALEFGCVTAEGVEFCDVVFDGGIGREEADSRILETVEVTLVVVVGVTLVVVVVTTLAMDDLAEITSFEGIGCVISSNYIPYYPSRNCRLKK
jgi:hypothetical protein